MAWVETQPGTVLANVQPGAATVLPNAVEMTSVAAMLPDAVNFQPGAATMHPNAVNVQPGAFAMNIQPGAVTVQTGCFTCLAGCFTCLEAVGSWWLARSASSPQHMVGPPPQVDTEEHLWKDLKGKLLQQSVAEGLIVVEGEQQADGSWFKPTQVRFSATEKEAAGYSNCIRFHQLKLPTHVGFKYDDEMPDRVVVLMGPSSTGKTTLLNGLANHVFGVDFDDGFRFECGAAATSSMVAYKFPIFENGKYSYNLTIVDTPAISDQPALSHLLSQLQEAMEKNLLPGIDLVALMMQEPVNGTGSYKEMDPNLLSLYQSMCEAMEGHNLISLASCNVSGSEACHRRFLGDAGLQIPMHGTYNLQCLRAENNNLSRPQWSACEELFKSMFKVLPKLRKVRQLAGACVCIQQATRPSQHSERRKLVLEAEMKLSGDKVVLEAEMKLLRESVHFIEHITKEVARVERECDYKFDPRTVRNVFAHGSCEFRDQVQKEIVPVLRSRLFLMLREFSVKLQLLGLMPEAPPASFTEIWRPLFAQLESVGYSVNPEAVLQQMIGIGS